jgi:YHS domain-containing protein
MAIQHTSRTGKTYYLCIGPKRGGGVQYYFSTKPAGALAEHLPEGFEVHESIHGQVFLRRKQPRLIWDEEIACIEDRLRQQRGNTLYEVEVRGETFTIFESQDHFGAIAAHFGGFPLRDPSKQDELRRQFASYQPVMRFILVDAAKRQFAPERYCFRGSVEDWIPIGPPDSIQKLAAKYLKHLGQESFFELF